MRDGGRADAAFGADHGDDAADRLGLRRGKQPADRAHHIDGADRGDQIVADAAPGQFAIQRDIVDAANHDDARAGVAALGQLVQTAENAVAAGFRLDDDDIRRRRGAIGFDRGGGAAHLDFNVRLAETAILAGGLHGGGGLDRFAKRLHRDARRRRDMFFGNGGRHGRRRLIRCEGNLTGVLDHLPILLILPVS